jgi:chemotaxis methyl-accepting protein methylase
MNKNINPFVGIAVALATSNTLSASSDVKIYAYDQNTELLERTKLALCRTMTLRPLISFPGT